MASIKNIHNPNKLNFRGIVKESVELQKAYEEGIYSDTPQNRKLGRVGMSYAVYAAKVNGQKTSGAVEAYKTNAIFKNAPLLANATGPQVNKYIDTLNHEIEGKHRDPEGFLISKEGDLETKKNNIVNHFIKEYKLTNIEFSKRGEFIDDKFSSFLEKSTYVKSAKEGKSNLFTMNANEAYKLNDELFEQVKDLKKYKEKREKVIQLLEKEFGGKYKGSDVIEVNYTLPKEEYNKQKIQLEEGLKNQRDFTSFKIKSTQVPGEDVFVCEVNGIGDLIVAPVISKPACEIWVPLYKDSESGAQMTVSCEGKGFRVVDQDNANEFYLTKMSDLKKEMKKKNYV